MDEVVEGGIFIPFVQKGVTILLMAEILHQLIGSISHCLQGFLHPRWCRISATNSELMRGEVIL